MSTPLASRPTAVYRCFDEGGRLLYVGISADPKGRFSDHKAEKSWWSDVDKAKVTWCRNRLTALRREARAIADEKPLFNITQPNPDRIKAPRTPIVEVPELPRMTLERAAAVLDVVPGSLQRAVAKGRVPHCCNRNGIWFTPKNLQDLRLIYMPRTPWTVFGDEGHRKQFRAAKRALWLRICPHTA